MAEKETNQNNDNKEEWKNKPPYLNQQSFTPKYFASCFCGSVTYEIANDPLDGTYCHCRSCQVMHAAPFQWANIFNKEDIRFTSGVDHLIFFNSSSCSSFHELPCKVACKKCRTPIADEGRRMWLAFPSLIRNFSSLKDKFRPSCHIFYGQRCIDIKDGLPKYEGHKNKSELLPD